MRFLLFAGAEIKHELLGFMFLSCEGEQEFLFFEEMMLDEGLRLLPETVEFLFQGGGDGEDGGLCLLLYLVVLLLEGYYFLLQLADGGLQIGEVRLEGEDFVSFLKEGFVKFKVGG